MTIELSEQEARVLVQLLDLAVKAGGLNAAAPAATIANKITPNLAENAPEPDVEAGE